MEPYGLEPQGKTCKPQLYSQGSPGRPDWKSRSDSMRGIGGGGAEKRCGKAAPAAGEAEGWKNHSVDAVRLMSIGMPACPGVPGKDGAMGCAGDAAPNTSASAEACPQLSQLSFRCKLGHFNPVLPCLAYRVLSYSVVSAVEKRHAISGWLFVLKYTYVPAQPCADR